MIAICTILIGCHAQKQFSKKDVLRAQKLYGLKIDKKYLDQIHPYLLRNGEGYDTLRTANISNETSPALEFNPHPKYFNYTFSKTTTTNKWEADLKVVRPKNKSSIAFLNIPQLAGLLQTNQITSVELTRLYLERIQKFNSSLEAVITVTEERAMAQAKAADELFEKGEIKSILQGIPWGVKDLAAVKDYPTTWGAMPYRNRMIDYNAAVVEKLDAAGAILIAKLVSGALARGDVWFDGKTKNPWDLEQGASGSSAGSGSATAAGLVGFSLGTETWGSIASPASRNGVTGLRPTYNTVSRYGVMSLSWSMDKVGPICRSATDCAIVFDFIRGSSSLDEHIPNIKYESFIAKKLKDFKVGICIDLIEKDTSVQGRRLRDVVSLLEENNITFDSVSIPKSLPSQAFDIILRAEAGAFFDELVRSGKVDQMVEQHGRSRANSLRQARFIPAVEYIQANRVRRNLIEKMNKLLNNYDVVISPTFGGNQSLITNLTGHPSITIPTGFDKKGRPTSMTIIGNLYEETKVIALANWYQQHTEWLVKRPKGFE